MGVDTRKPPLPAPTESGTEVGSVAPTEVATDVSRQTERTSYSIPEDGSPITISTKKIKNEKATGPGSQTSLLIEYFEASKPGEKDHRRPSVRVKVTPSAKKVKANGDVKITEIGSDSKPSYTRRIHLGNKGEAKITEESEVSSRSNESGRPPIEVEFVNNPSDISSSTTSRGRYLQTTSDISSMPADSMLDDPIAITNIPQPGGSESQRKLPDEAAQSDTLKAPDNLHSRNLSRERITQKVMEKLAQDKTGRESTRPRRLQKNRGDVPSDNSEENMKSKSRRSSKSSQDNDVRAGTDSSHLRTRDGESNISGTSKSSLNNPKLLQTVEDAIRRLILPEIETIKRQQSVHENTRRFDRGGRDSYITDGTESRRQSGRSLSSSASAPHMKPTVVLNRDENDPGVVLSGDSVRHKKHRRSSHDLESSRSRRQSSESAETQRLQRSRERSRAKEAAAEAAGGGVLTVAALKNHESQSRSNSRDAAAKERRKKHSTSRSRSNSLANTDEDYYTPYREIPPMPMQSEIIDSDLTRESILSAETADTERPRSNSLKHSGTPVREVSRGSPRTIIQTRSGTSTRTPSRLQGGASPDRARSQVDLSSPKSDLSIRSRAKAAALASAGLGGAAGALYTQDSTKSSDRNSFETGTPKNNSGANRGLSPIHSESGYQRNGTLSSRQAREAQGEAGSDSPVPMNTKEKPYKASLDSVQSNLSARYPLTQKRHKGVNLEDDHGAQDQDLRRSSFEEERRGAVDAFYDRQHELNDQYRSSREYNNHRDSPQMDSQHPHNLQESSFQRYLANGTTNTGTQVKDIGASANYAEFLTPVESNVASLLNPSVVSSDLARTDKPVLRHMPSADDVADAPLAARDRMFTESEVGGSYQTRHENTSVDRWNAIRGRVQNLNSSPTKDGVFFKSPPQSVTESMESEEHVAMGASSLPVAGDPLPEIGHGVDDNDDVTTNPSENSGRRSIVEERLGGDFIHRNRNHWPYEPTPPQNKRDGFVDPYDQEEHYIGAGNATLTDAAAGLGIGNAPMDQRSVDSPGRSYPQERSQSSASPRYNHKTTREALYTRDLQSDRAYQPPTPANLKDEGYISAAQARSPGAVTPLSFSKPPPPLFDDDGNESVEDPFVGQQHDRHLSGHSHGMAPAYDASTGNGVSNIQSQDVVALMDHLTVRDGHRNARDTEILVTLVRSAADMRNSFDEMKKFIEQQNKLNMQRTDIDSERTVSKILGASRLQGSQVRNSRALSAEADDPAVKKQNVFKRALKGLSGRSTSDLSRIEDMLMQLLDEMEDLRESQGLRSVPDMQGFPASPGAHQPSIRVQQSLDSYERLRAAPESGYEPEGQAGTGSTPNHSGRLTSSPQSRQAQRMHSGYIDRRESGNRISTVMEGDEDGEDDQGFENDDGMLTPTEETRRKRAESYVQPRPEPVALGSLETSPVTPRTMEKQRKHKSSSSSIFGMPKISRWSKTTASSSVPDNRGSYQKNRPSSEASRSGSIVNVLPPDAAYTVAEEDRFRRDAPPSRDSEQYSRPQSPLVPTSDRPISMDDPKYQANRHSLTLEHPQPRPGPTPRHQSHLESQASAYGPNDRAATSPLSPESDTFGSMPSLARIPGGGFGANRLSAPHYNGQLCGVGGPSQLSPLSSEGSHSEDMQNGHNSYAPPRPPKVRDDGPLVPAKVPVQQIHSVLLQNEINRPVGKNDPDGQQRDGEGLEHRDQRSSDDSHENNQEWRDGAIPLSRKRSPYLPGGRLAPIEERYSLEQARSMNSRQGSRRYSMDPEHERYSIAEAEVDEAFVGDRATTPQLDPRPALGAPSGESPRKLTGPREMPRSGSGGSGPPAGGPQAAGPRDMPRNGNGGGVPLKGTVRRKPMPGRLEEVAS